MSSRFGPDPKAFFDDVYRGPAPWDVGSPQPELLGLIDAFPPASPILDVGCGTGDLAIELAARGYEAIGIDFAAAAIQEANHRAARLDAKARQRVRFEVGDALRPSALGEPIGAVVDSGFMHLFEKDVRDAFAADLAAALRPGGRYYLLAFAVTFPIENAPLQVDPDEVARRLSPERGWRVLACRQAEFHSRIAAVPAIAACVERTG